ncbi:MAG: biopolymer transporter ExbD [Planctomycetaceae bacterium]|jgi:biopolymer transport protein ExbD|nr:biopolymer transporter ExbD [Planctomycetaceae bacterium]MCE2812018.1 biopolymer transporter ExbD [Planctomycetaceae bacterium]
MALKPKFDAKAAEGDMTSMIDMVFQLIIFFMVLINFSQDDQNQAIKLPSSELAKPADAPLENPIVLNLAFNGKVYIGPETATIAGLRPLLETEAKVLNASGKSAKDANVIIRADGNTAGGMVQELIKKCQESGYEKFALRAKEEIGQ